MNREKTIDCLKAFSIIMVVFYHSVFSAGLSWSSISYIRLVLLLKNIHVPLFIVIAGYLCHCQPIKEFYTKKVTRILIPFLFMSCLKLLCGYFITTEYNHAEDFLSQLYDAFICGNLYWYCYCLLIIFLLVPLIWKSRTCKWGTLIVFTILDLILVYTGRGITDVLQLTQVAYYIPLFVSGMLLRDYQAVRKLNSRSSRLVALAVSLFVFGMSFYLRLIRDINNIYILDVILGMSAMFLLYVISESLIKISAFRFLETLGKYSYQIMLLDSLFRVIVFYFLGKVLNQGIIMVVIAAAVDIILSVAACKIAERIPGISLLFGLRHIKR